MKIISNDNTTPIEFDDTVILFPNACLILDGDEDGFKEVI